MSSPAPQTSAPKCLMRCTWAVYARRVAYHWFRPVAYHRLRDDAEEEAYRVLKRLRDAEWDGAEILIRPIFGEEPMSTTDTYSTRSGEATLTLTWPRGASSGDLYLRFGDGHTVHKHYEWWQLTEAEGDRETLRLALEEQADAYRLSQARVKQAAARAAKKQQAPVAA